jgi:hypothetical protein
MSAIVTVNHLIVFIEYDRFSGSRADVQAYVQQGHANHLVYKTIHRERDNAACVKGFRLIPISDQQAVFDVA